MKILRQFLLILSIWLIGELMNKVLFVPIPGSVLGMLILLILLNLKIVKIEMIEEISDFILKNLSFFFIPPGVALIGAMEILKDSWWKILIISVSTTFIVMAVTGLVVQNMIKRR